MNGQLLPFDQSPTALVDQVTRDYGAWLHPEHGWMRVQSYASHAAVARRQFGIPEDKSAYRTMWDQGWVRVLVREDREAWAVEFDTKQRYPRPFLRRLGAVARAFTKHGRTHVRADVLVYRPDPKSHWLHTDKPEQLVTFLTDLIAEPEQLEMFPSYALAA